MTSLWNKKAVLYAPLIFILLFAVACGSSAEPVIVEKEVIKEVIKEVPVIKEVIKEVPKEVIVEKEVVKEVYRDVMVIATPVAAPVEAKGKEAWEDIAAGKHYRGVFPLMAIRNPGFWDVHYGGSRPHPIESPIQWTGGIRPSQPDRDHRRSGQDMGSERSRRRLHVPTARGRPVE